MDTTKAITHLSLCSGYEGIGLGLRSVLPTMREIAYVEREGFPIANLVAKMEAGELDAAPVFTDVKTFPYGKFRGIVDILSGGFPCQPFSAAGKRQATEDPRHLFPYIADGIRECQPRIVFLENVQGILSCKTADGEPVLQHVLRELEGMGYRATAGIFSAEEVGAPHQRKRVFIMAYRNSVRHDGRELSDRDSGWSLPKQAQPRTEQPLVWGEVEGRSGDSRKELAYSNDCGSVRGDEIGSDQVRQVEQHSTQRKDSPIGRGETGQLANGISAGLEGHSGNEQGEGRQSIRQGRPVTASGLPPRWPSRPGEPQYDWEEPRVTGQAESQLGRASNGSSSRVDRLRLLGNGVVPQTAAKAFITLINRLV